MMHSEPRTSFLPGQPWLDTNGHRIQAHGGSIIVLDDVYYWYGENKEMTRPGNGIWHWGIRLYASTDLYNWEDRGIIIPPTPDDPSNVMHPSRCVDRPHIVHDPVRNRFVCWIKVMGAEVQESTVFVADRIEGPYEMVQTGLRPLGMSAGDFDLVIDPTDGRGYYYFEKVHSEVIVADLTEDYTDVAGTYTSHLPRPGIPQVREAPAHFERDGKHYLFTSGTSWYIPNVTEVAVADRHHGPWTTLGAAHVDDIYENSFRSQITSVFKVPGRELHIALADRWIPGLSSEKSRDLYIEFEQVVTGRRTLDGDPPEFDTSVADYVWLPVRFDGDRPYLTWSDEWRLEDLDAAR